MMLEKIKLLPPVGKKWYIILSIMKEEEVFESTT